tara:strand:+ start:5058 stop:6308 length:1251 start_codon:yes stop_codon:yes gene_type:complete
MSKYSALNLIRHAFSNNKNWQLAIKDAEPKKSYDAIIVGGGGHGLASAYYLAKNHNLKNIAVVEKGWIGGGNTARNTTIVRSNYLWTEASLLYEKSLKLWEGLSQDLNFNVMFSQRGVYNLGHTLQDMRDIERRVSANKLNGIDAEVVDAKQIKKNIPSINTSTSARYPILGASLQRRAGVARHDAVAWGYARAAAQLGVDIIQQCEVTGILKSNNQVYGLETSKGRIESNKIGLVVAGHASVLAEKADLRLPLESHPLQAYVSEPLKPVLDTVVMSNAVHGYISQSDKGELVIGAGIDPYIGYGQKGSFCTIEHCMQAIMELFPHFSRVRMLRQWGGIVDVSPDACPIISKTPIEGLYINCGWGTGGFKATPGSGWVFAHTLANNEAHQLNAPFSLDRFSSGALIDEHGAAAVAH